MAKGAISWTFEIIGKLLLVIVFILGVIFLIFILQQRSIQEVNQLNPQTFIENLIGKK